VRPTVRVHRPGHRRHRQHRRLAGHLAGQEGHHALRRRPGQGSLNFNITLALVGVALAILTFITFGLGAILTIPARLLLFLAWLVLPITAAIKANEGVAYRYPFALRRVKEARPSRWIRYGPGNDRALWFSIRWRSVPGRSGRTLRLTEGDRSMNQ